jgi:hypothetical protein
MQGIALVQIVGSFVVNGEPIQGAVLTFPNGPPDYPFGIVWKQEPMRLARQDTYDDILAALKSALAFLENEISYHRDDAAKDGSFNAAARALSDQLRAAIEKAEG